MFGVSRHQRVKAHQAATLLYLDDRSKSLQHAMSCWSRLEDVIRMKTHDSKPNSSLHLLSPGPLFRLQVLTKAGAIIGCSLGMLPVQAGRGWEADWWDLSGKVYTRKAVQAKAVSTKAVPTAPSVLQCQYLKIQTSQQRFNFTSLPSPMEKTNGRGIVQTVISNSPAYLARI